MIFYYYIKSTYNITISVRKRKKVYVNDQKFNTCTQILNTHKLPPILKFTEHFLTYQKIYIIIILLQIKYQI